MNRYLVSALALASLGSFGAAHACESTGVKIAKVMTATVGTYDRQGNFLADIEKKDIDDTKDIIACQDSPSLIQVWLKPAADGKAHSAWVSLLEVKVSGTGKSRKCQDEAISRVADTTTPATSGIDPCGHD